MVGDRNPLLNNANKTKSLDEKIELSIGDFRWSQLLRAILISFAWFFDAQQSFISIFTDAEPKWSCNSSSSSSSCNNTTSNICQLPRNAWSWAEPQTTSIISEWNLECAGSITTGFPASCLFLGGLIGGFALATLADSSLGRKNMLVLSCLLMSLAGALTALSNNIWVYSSLRFVGGFWRPMVGTNALVLSTELVGRKSRGIASFVNFFSFTLGFLSLPLIAFLLEGSSWRLIYLWISVPATLYSLLVYFLVHESPRWLYVKGRKDEFMETLRSIAPPSYRGILTQSFFEEINDGNNSQEVTDIFSAMKALTKKDWAFRRLSTLMIVGFGVGTMYYGIPLGLGNLSINLYLSVTLNAIFEFPASFLTFFLIGRSDRRASILGLTLISSLCCVCCVLVQWNNIIQIGLELVSFCSACTAFDVVLIYCLELYPTCVRNSALSVVRQSFLFGAILSPLLVALGRKKGLLLSYGAFGLAIGVCGVFVLRLPETRGRVSCDTMEEEEAKMINNGRVVIRDDEIHYCA